MKGRKSLGPEDLRLWSRVIAEARPFPNRKPPVPEAPEISAPQHRPASAPPLSHYAGIEGTIRQRLRRGTIRIEDRLDLHGLRQDEAHAALNAFLSSAQARGARLVLVITGKGRGRDSTLRRLVPLWLTEGINRFRIALVTQADARHGGGGALYVYLARRAGSPSMSESSAD